MSLLSLYAPEKAWDLIPGIPAVVIVPVNNSHRMRPGSDNLRPDRIHLAERPYRNAFGACGRQQKWFETHLVKEFTPYGIGTRHVALLSSEKAQIIVNIRPRTIQGYTDSPHNTVGYLFPHGVRIAFNPHPVSLLRLPFPRQ